MPLLLAVEPDPEQLSKLSSLVGKLTDAELVSASTAAAALVALGDRIPDVILTSPLITPKDEALLAMRMRELGDRASHAQRLTIPVLGEPRKVRGFFSGLMGYRGQKSFNQGCDPEAFGAEIGVYLEHGLTSRAERALRTPPPPALPAASATSGTPPLEELLVGVVVKPTLDDSSSAEESGRSEASSNASPTLDGDRDVFESRAEADAGAGLPSGQPSRRRGWFWSSPISCTPR